MQIQFPTHLAAPASAPVAAVLPWAVNDILLAEVVGTDSGNFTRLAIGGRVVTAHTNVALTLGQKLDLRVTSSGTTTVLTVVEDTQKMPLTTLSRGLARVLPQQASPRATEQLLRSIDVIVGNTRAVAAAIGGAAAANLSQHIEHLLQALPTPTQLSNPTQLRSAMEQVLAPTEARLLSALGDGSAPDVAGDLRVHFARIAIDLAALATPARNALEQVIRQTLTSHHRRVSHTPPAALDSNARIPNALPSDHRGDDLKTLVDSVVARLEANQFQTLANTPAEPLPLLFDVPLVHHGEVDLLRMEVEQEPCLTDSEALARTTVTLNLRLDGAHQFSARLQLNGERLSVRIGAGDAEFNNEITQHIGELEHNLNAAGLDVSQIFIAPLTMSSHPRLGHRQLINERI